MKKMMAFKVTLQFQEFLSVLVMANAGNDFKWFGEGFDGFPRSLPEDCVEYTIYIVGAKLKDIELRIRLREVQKAAEKLTRDLLRDFIWQRDPFLLKLERNSHRSYLQGRTNYGDSVDDEWLVVYLLRELSRQFPETWIRVTDSDGQFLLIEAANALPIWLNPEIADYRAWISAGRLLVIPLEDPGGKGHKNKNGSDNLSLEDALGWIANPDRKLRHSMKIETEAFFRLAKYPQQINDSLHHAFTTVPRKLAYLLHIKASYISPAIEAFYLRDSIALRSLSKPTERGPLFAPKDLVKISVPFTKVGYAQLRGQQFVAPQAWTTIIETAEPGKASMRAEMGMKVTCGFEMLLSDKLNQDKQVVREIRLLLEDLESGEAELPSNEEVRGWSSRDDDDSWLDINFNEFEKELAGKPTPNQHRDNAGFGDKAAHENLQMIVERFQGFLQDGGEGPDGESLVDEMDNDDDDDDDDDDDSSASKDDLDSIKSDHSTRNIEEDEFSAMMRELMNMPEEVMKEVMTNPSIKANRATNLEASFRANEIGSSSDDGEEEGILQAMEQTEEELREAGVLELEPQTKLNIKAQRFDAIEGATSSATRKNASS